MHKYRHDVRVVGQPLDCGCCDHGRRDQFVGIHTPSARFDHSVAPDWMGDPICPGSFDLGGWLRENYPIQGGDWVTEVQNGRGIIGCGASADPIDASGELGLVFINTQPADEDFKPSSEVRGLQPVDLGVTTGYITADISGRTLRFDTEPAIAANFVTVVGNVKGEDVTPAAAKLGSAFARVMAYQATRSTTPLLRRPLPSERLRLPRR